MTKKPIIIISVFWAILQIIYYYKLRSFIGFESNKYIYEAQFVNAFHHFSYPHYYLYSLYIFLHVFFMKLGFELYGVYFTQLICSYIATLLFYKILLHTIENKRLAFAGILLWLCCFHFHRFTAFLYTESLFGSFIIIQAYWLLFKPFNNRNLILLSILSLIVILARPTGIVFIPIWVSYWVFNLFQKRKTVAAITVIVSMLLAVSGMLYLIVSRTDMGFNFIIPFTHNYVQCYVFDKTLQEYSLNITNDGNPVYIFFYYLLHNPLHFLHAAWLKTIAYFSITRSYYSGLHNMFIRAFYYPIYLSGILAIWTNRKQLPLWIVYSMISIIFFTISIILTCEDWSSRFIIPITPFIILLGIKGIDSMMKIYLGKDREA